MRSGKEEGGGIGKKARMPGRSDTESILSQSKTQKQDFFFSSFQQAECALCIKASVGSSLLLWGTGPLREGSSCNTVCWWRWWCGLMSHTHTHSNTHKAQHAINTGAMGDKARCQWARKQINEDECESDRKTDCQIRSLLFARLQHFIVFTTWRVGIVFLVSTQGQTHL